jgi:secreted PhoX family phosphatase
LRLGLGVFKHEAATIDRVAHHVYLTEDEPNGCLYRFVPDRLGPHGFADLSSGRLQVAELMSSGLVTWRDVPDPQYEGAKPTREQVASATPFNGGEGIWWHEGVVYFSTKGDDRIWAYDTLTSKLSVLYDARTAKNPILTGVDNITVSASGDVLVAEDGGDMQVVAILPNGELKALVQVIGHDDSEITGLAFDPHGGRLYFNSQSGAGSGGVTYELAGPFHVLQR